MLRLISLCLALLAGADALKLPSVVSRRDLATYAAGAIAALPLAANAAAGARIEAGGTAAGVQTGKLPKDLRAPRDLIGVRFQGTYSDPAHPGCTRRITLAGRNAIITGADEDGKPWKVAAVPQGDKILVDFSPKGGPADVVGQWLGTGGIKFPDGNVWAKLN